MSASRSALGFQSCGLLLRPANHIYGNDVVQDSGAFMSLTCRKSAEHVPANLSIGSKLSFCFDDDILSFHPLDGRLRQDVTFVSLATKSSPLFERLPP